MLPSPSNSSRCILALLLVAALGTLLSGCVRTPEPELPSEVQAIRSRGTIRVGVFNDAPGFSLLDPETNTYSGLEADLAYELAQAIFGDSSRVTFVPVTERTGITILDNRQIDVLIARFAFMPERTESWNISKPYYTNATGFLVNADAEITSLEDLDNKRIGVIMRTPTRELLDEVARIEGMLLAFTEFGSYPEASTALARGRIDAMSADRSLLHAYENDTRMILEDVVGVQEYGMVTRKDYRELADYLDEFIGRLILDGTLERLVRDNGL